MQTHYAVHQDAVLQLLVAELKSPTPALLTHIKSMVYGNALSIADIKQMATVFNDLAAQLGLRLARQTRGRKRKSVFTNHEQKILALLARGLSSQDISNALHISRHTVNTHRRNMRKKISAANTAEMLTMAGEMGIVLQA